jgi:hypothetical protein
MRRRLITSLTVVAIAAAGATAASAVTDAGDPAPRVTVVADSVGGALTWMGRARAILARGIELDLEIAACRKLVEPGCVYQGERPPSALELIRSRSVPLGRVVVVNVGYNDLASDYPEGLDRVMRALEARGVERVVWVTLRAERASYAEMNAAIGRALGRWPQLVVADWSAASAGREEWFTDGLHLSDAGGEAFARFLRPVVLGACGAPCGPDGSLLAVASTKLVGARASTPFVARLQARGGTEPYRWSVQGLPRPLRVSAAGVVTGRPRSSGRFRLTVRVSDAVGVQNEGVVMLRVAPKR